MLVCGTLRTPSAPVQQEWAIRLAEVCFATAAIYEFARSSLDSTSLLAICLQIAGFLCLPLGTRARLSKLRRCARLNEAPDTWPRLQWQIEIQCFLLLSLGSASAAFMALLDQNTSHTGQAILYGLRSYVWPLQMYAMYYCYVQGAFDSPVDEVPLYCLPEFRRPRAREFNRWMGQRLWWFRLWSMSINLPLVYHVVARLLSALKDVVYILLTDCDPLGRCNVTVGGFLQREFAVLTGRLASWSIFPNEGFPNVAMLMMIGYLVVSIVVYCIAVCSVVYVSAARCSGAVQSSEEKWQWELGSQGHFDHQVKPPSITAQISKSLRIVVLTIGTRGDVQPFITLGQSLKERGHQVAIASSNNFRTLVEGGGLDFLSIGMEKLEQPNSWLEVKSVGEMMERTFEVIKDEYFNVASGFYAAVRGEEKTSRKQRNEGESETSKLFGPADVIIATAHTASFGLNISEATGIPCWQAKLAPDIPSNAFGPPGTETSSCGFVNYIRHIFAWIRIGLAVRNVPIQDMENKWRKNELKLETDTPAERILEMFYGPQLLAVSPILFPKPLDYPEWVFECGFWTNTASSQWNPPEWLREFLEEPSKQRIVCITFGSMVLATSSGVVSTLALEALRYGHKVLLMTGWADPPEDLGSYLPNWEAIHKQQMHLSPDEKDRKKKLGYGRKESLAVIDAAPHDWVFERCHVVCHHGGAGTTASILAAGRPSVVVPILRWADQMQWADMVETAGVGVKVRGWPPSSSELRAALWKAMTSKSIEENADRSGARLRAERSGESAANALESCLCTVVLPPEQAAILKEENIDPNKLNRTQRMCLRHCVQCNLNKGSSKLLKRSNAYANGRDVNFLRQSMLNTYRMLRNEDPTMGHAEAFSMKTSWKNMFFRGYSSFAETVSYFGGSKALKSVKETAQRFRKKYDGSEDENYSKFVENLLQLFAHTKEQPIARSPGFNTGTRRHITPK